MDRSTTLLGLVGAGTTHGYDLKHRYDALFGAAGAIAYGQIYATLSRMIRDDLVELVGVEPGDGPDRKRYAITDLGRRRLRAWLRTTQVPAPPAQTDLFAKTVLTLLLEDDADAVLDVQRTGLLQAMRTLVADKARAPLLERLAIDHALFQIEADLRWIDMTSARLTELKTEVTAHG